MRYDLIGIREFAEVLTREGGFTSGGIISNRKALEGARLHRHVQKRLAAEHADFLSEKAGLYTVNHVCVLMHSTIKNKLLNKIHLSIKQCLYVQRILL